MSGISVESGVCWPTAKWNAAGRRTAITETVSSEELSCVAPVISGGRRGSAVNVRVAETCDYSLTPKPCSEKRVPPAKKHIPRTRTECAKSGTFPRNARRQGTYGGY